MDILIESMTKVIFPPYTIRCWRQEDRYSDAVKAKTLEEIYLALKKINGMRYKIFPGDGVAFVAKELIKMDRMNAVEVIEDDGNGVVLYKNWP